MRSVVRYNSGYVYAVLCFLLFDLTVLMGLFTYLTPFRLWHTQHVNFTDPSGHLDSFVVKGYRKKSSDLRGGW